MGTELVGDHYLALMLMPGDPASRPAARLLRAQILTYNRTGHIIGMSEELPKRRICEAAKRGTIPRIYLRCLRCGAPAWLNDWIAGAELAFEERSDRLCQLEALGKGDLSQFLRRCTGAEYLESVANLADQPEDWGSG